MMETLVLEGDNPAAALVKYISDSNITYLVMGSCSSNFITRKIKGPGIPSAVLKDVPGTCIVYVLSPQNLLTNSVNALSTSGRSSKIWLFSQNKHGSFNIKKLPSGHYYSYVESKDLDMIGASSRTDPSDPYSQALIQAVLLKMLPSYYDNVKEHENTLFTKFFGVHEIMWKAGKKIHFVVMGNMFCTELRIHRRYDLN